MGGSVNIKCAALSVKVSHIFLPAQTASCPQLCLACNCRKSRSLVRAGEWCHLKHSWKLCNIDPADNRQGVLQCCDHQDWNHRCSRVTHQSRQTPTITLIISLTFVSKSSATSNSQHQLVKIAACAAGADGTLTHPWALPNVANPWMH